MSYYVFVCFVVKRLLLHGDIPVRMPHFVFPESFSFPFRMSANEQKERHEQLVGEVRSTWPPPSPIEPSILISSFIAPIV